MKRNPHTNLQAFIYTAKQSLTFVISVVCIIIFVGMMTVGVLKLQPFSVASNSMEPTLKVGELVFVKSTDNYKVGDVLSFVSQQHGGIVITHRCIDVKNVSGTLHYYCTGDNLEAGGSVQDVMADDVVGKVVYSSVALGKITNYVQNNKVFILMILASLLLGVYILNNIDIYNKDKYYIGRIHT